MSTNHILVKVAMQTTMELRTMETTMEPKTMVTLMLFKTTMVTNNVLYNLAENKLILLIWNWYYDFKTINC